jgi:hypothetical protein
LDNNSCQKKVSWVIDRLSRVWIFIHSFGTEWPVFPSKERERERPHGTLYVRPHGTLYVRLHCRVYVRPHCWVYLRLHCWLYLRLHRRIIP